MAQNDSARPRSRVPDSITLQKNFVGLIVKLTACNRRTVLKLMRNAMQCVCRMPKVSVYYLTVSECRFSFVAKMLQGRNQLFISGEAIFINFHSMTSSCLFNRDTTFSQAVTDLRSQHFQK